MKQKTIMLELSEVRANYGSIQALRQANLIVNEGEIVTLIGANGAGKTTTLLSIIGIHKIKSGSITFANSNLTRLQPHEIVRCGISLVPEGRKIFSRLTVLENLQLGAYTRQKKETKDDLARIFELFPILKERRKQMGGTLSGGEQQMLAIGRALMSRPRMLLMDEPSMGIAPIIVQKIFDAIVKLNQEGMTILLIEQSAKIALKIATRGYVMENGQTIISDDSAALIAHPKLLEAYLG